MDQQHIAVLVMGLELPVCRRHIGEIQTAVDDGIGAVLILLHLRLGGVHDIPVGIQRRLQTVLPHDLIIHIVGGGNIKGAGEEPLAVGHHRQISVQILRFPAGMRIDGAKDVLRPDGGLPRRISSLPCFFHAVRPVIPARRKQSGYRHGARQQQQRQRPYQERSKGLLHCAAPPFAAA